MDLRIGLVFLLLMSFWVAGRDIDAAQRGVKPGESSDCGPALRALLEEAAREPGCRVVLQPGCYHLYAESAPKRRLYISNHDQAPEHAVGLELCGAQGASLVGEGAELVFHGCMLGVLVQDSRDVTLEGLRLRYALPAECEGVITDISEQGTVLRMLTDRAAWEVKEGAFFNCGSGIPLRVKAAFAFLPDGRVVPTGKAGDIAWSARAEQTDAEHVRFALDARAFGLAPGQVVVLRDYARPHPAVMLYRAENTLLRNVVIHDSQGMGLLAQRSRDIRLAGGGCLRLPGRMHTTSADATHFSNCAGHISVQGATFESMMDDAINVHSTCLQIAELLSPTRFVARYAHPQAIGFETFLPGERVQFIRAATLENIPLLGRVRRAVFRSPELVEIETEQPLPAGIGPGDALENADFYPSVDFSNCTVRHNRARGVLFTTPSPVTVRNNLFDWCSGSAVLLAGDAQGWFESGRCLDVRIENNVFDHALTNLYQFTEAVISVYPMVRKPAEQREPYHRGIRITGNTFRTHRVPLLFATSAADITFRGNRVEYDEAAPPQRGGQPFILRHCGAVDSDQPAP